MNECLLRMLFNYLKLTVGGPDDKKSFKLLKK